MELVLVEPPHHVLCIQRRSKKNSPLLGLFLFCVYIKINIFQGTNSIAGGDVVLVIENISAISGRPDPGDFRFLRPSVYFDSAYFVQGYHTFHKISVWNLPDLDENARNF